MSKIGISSFTQPLIFSEDLKIRKKVVNSPSKTKVIHTRQEKHFKRLRW